MDREEDLRRRIAALEELIALEDNARLTDLKAYHQRVMNTSTLQNRQQVRSRNTNQLQQEIIDLQRRLRAMHVTWEPGAQLDNYILRRVLGSGGNGQVWMAETPLLDGKTRQVAIKVLREEIAEDPERVHRFRHEISVMARIYHPHIVPIYTYGDQSGQLYAVMPYFSEGTLRDRLNGQPILEEEALSWLEQIGAALDHVHDRYTGLIHRDVKPENMLVSDEGNTLYLADFGLVFSSSEGSENITRGDKPVGTGRYMAPEQWNHEPLSRSTDLYALGILAYELLTGHLPFQETNDRALANAHCERDLPSDPRLTDEVLRILRRATAKHPSDRYPSARAFLTDLRNWRVDSSNIVPRIHDYLNWIKGDLYNRVRAQFVDLMGDEKVLRFRPKRPKTATLDEDDLFAWASADRQADHITEEDTATLHFVPNVRERLLTVKRAVLVGEPGSGKSWMLRHLQADYARSWLGEKRISRRLIPVLIKLNEYTGGPFIEVVKTALDTLAPYHDHLRREKRLVILCDGLNEMPRGAGQLKELVQYLKAAQYFVVSCRVRDYRDDLDELKPLEQVILRDLELPSIRDLIYKRLPEEQAKTLWKDMGGTEVLEQFWNKVQVNNDGDLFWTMSTNWTYVKYGYAANVPKEWYLMHQGSRLLPLCRNPFMADLLARLYKSLGDLPDTRAELFEEFIDEMLRREAKVSTRRGEKFPAEEEIKAALVSLAWALQDAERTVISEPDALVAVQKAKIESRGLELIRAALDSNILISDGEGLRFSHHLLQEYFAARILLEAMENNESPAQFFGETWWDAGVWRETIVILGEFLGDGARGPNRVMRWLAPVTPEVALDVIKRHGAGLTLDDIEEKTKQLLIDGARAKTREYNPVGRAAAYRVLGLWDQDKRSGIGLLNNGLPDIEWMTVHGGDYHYGHDNESDSPSQILSLPPFQMSRYPITYLQFQTFLDDPKGFHNPRWWEGFSDDETRHINQRRPGEQAFQYTNHPRDNVNWYDAMAFCRWLSFRLGGGFDLNHVTRWAVRLPSEFEWEKAARGRDGRLYPYGNDFDPAKANTYETGIDQTNAVGMFGSKFSPYRLEELSGNVWEWCLTDYETPASDVASEILNTPARRVLRGGSWNVGRGRARSTYRLFNDPFGRLDIVGFRCVRPMP